MKKKEKDISDKMIFGKKSSVFSVWLSLIYMLCMGYLMFFLHELDYALEEKIIVAVVLAIILVYFILHGTHYVAIGANEICIISSSSSKIKIEIPIDTIKKIDFYLPNTGNFNPNFHIRIFIEGKHKKIDQPIGLSKKEITSLANHLKERGVVEVYCDLSID